jgi:hypothetical protein
MPSCTRSRLRRIAKTSVRVRLLVRGVPTAQGVQLEAERPPKFLLEV